jgi:dTDP-4-dehydrorhamnose reductase
VPQRILITGGTGLLGSTLVRTAAKDFAIVASYNKIFPITERAGFVQLDITDRKRVFDVFEEIMPDILIHTAALANVDYCETHKEEAWNVNVVGTANLLDACDEHGTKMIFTSTNAVFDGEHAPYSEEDKPNPINYYGKTKLEAETLVRMRGAKHAVARLMTMYGWNNPGERQNLVTWLLSKLTKGEAVQMVDDIYNNHLFVGNCADAIWAIVKLDKAGLYHIAGGDCVSTYELALKTAEVFDLDKNLIKPVKSDLFKFPAPRPKNTCYVTEKMEKELKVRPLSIEEGLHYMKQHKPTWVK